MALNFNTNPALAVTTALGTGIAGGIPDPTSSSGNSTQTNNSTAYQNLQNYLQSFSKTQGNTSNTSTTNPNITAAHQALIDQLTQQYTSMIGKNLNTDQIRNPALSQINSSSNAQADAVKNIMAARGVSGPAAATADVNVQNSRFKNINDFDTQLPLLMQNLKLGNLNAASQFQSTIPHGTTTTSSGTTDNTTSGDQSNNQSTQGGQNGQTQTWQQQQQQQGGGLGGFLGGLFSILATL